MSEAIDRDRLAVVVNALRTALAVADNNRRLMLTSLGSTGANLVSESVARALNDALRTVEQLTPAEPLP